MSLISTYLAILVALVSIAFVKGCSYGQTEAEGKLAERNSQIETEVARRRSEVSEWVIEASRRREQTDAAIKARVIEVQTVTKTITNEVTKYVPLDSPMWVSSGWVRVHDAAAAGKAIPEGSRELVNSPSTVTATQSSQVVAGNYGKCLLAQEQVNGWIDWYETESSKWSK